MQNIIFKDGIPAGGSFEGIHRVIRSAAGALTSGCSLNSSGLIVHMHDLATDADLQKIHQVVSAYGQMVVTADKLVIVADDTDFATLTCADARLNSDAKIDYRVYVDGILYAEGNEPVTGGSVSLEFATATPGVYTIEISRRKGNFATGVISIEAVE